MNNYTKNQISEDDSCSVYSEPLIPDGQYKAVYLEHWTYSAPGTGKLVIHFKIAEGECEGEVLKAYFRVVLKGRSGKFGKFMASRQGEYFDQMCDLLPDLACGRTDRISPQRLKGKVVSIEVETVKKKWGGGERKPHTQYSTIRKLSSFC